MNCYTALQGIMLFDRAMYRKTWQNNRKALYIHTNGKLSICYENRKCVMTVSAYVLQSCDLKADDWLYIYLSAKKGSIKLDDIQEAVSNTHRNGRNQP